MLKKLEKLGAALSKLSNGVDDPLFKKLENYSGVLPSEYCDFLVNFSQGAEFDSSIVYKGVEASPWASKDGYDSLEYFYGLSNSEGEGDVFEFIEMYKDDLGNQWLPIASSDGGNQICLCLTGKMVGQIWFWDHEADPLYDENKVISGLSLAAHDLKDFISRLEIDKEEPDISGVKKVVLDF
ncbi:SMI1 / KNR4 family [Serratia marcescens]|uniref:SMI1/KNR4 family protein n=1 Tax=Serratia marcescens TaxID=615 RepID=UPI002177F1F6|nr:SMI1/KNR4 family protein [Serratia marcescens]CAI1527346.1 SMI1 / KNR4 family [Serratia marcescens]